jgi:hypothetical protein
VVLEQAHGLAQHGPADAVAGEQIGLRAEHGTDLPAARLDVVVDPGGDDLGELGARTLRRLGLDGPAGDPRGAADPVLLRPLGDGLQVRRQQSLRPRAVAGDHGLDDGVVLGVRGVLGVEHVGLREPA